MEGVDDDRTYRVNLNNEGETKLKESVTDKLKEFMGDYSDDTLVEYVIVLLRNGRCKEEARNELSVFLGDDTDSFVSWLWDHLSVNLHFYVPQQESFPDEAAETKSVLEEEAGGNNSLQLDSEPEREMTVKEPKSRRNREWKGLMRDAAEPPPLRSSEVDHLQIEKKYHQRNPRVKRPHSPQPPGRIARSRLDEREHTRREAPSSPSIGAPRRLLQFAMRDALGSLRSPSSKVNPTLKRLRSVVSTSSRDSSVDDQPQRIRSVARLPSAVTTLFKAAAEAAEDVTKVRGSANVFDRLGHGLNVSGVTNYASEVKATPMEDAQYEDFVADTQSIHPKRNDYLEEFGGDTPMLERDTGTAYDSASDNEGYDDVNVGHRVMNASQTGTSFGNKDEDSLMVQYSVANNTNEIARKRVKDQNPTAAGATTSRKIVNISVNVNTWKPPHYQAAQEVKEFKNLEDVRNSDTGATKPGFRLLKEDNKPVAPVNENEKGGARIQNESQKTLLSTPGAYSFGRPTEDADSRTVFVNNVHFAATKDTLSRHFNKFGEVLKVVIVTDAATGQPTGSAYIEFMRKEAAELALSLNGTSFMSRILKVVRKSSAYMESSNVLAWPRVSRASPFAAQLARVPFPRGMPAAFRTRLAVKPGARSLQWKRDTTPASEGNVNVSNGASSNNVPSPTGRSLTYVRKDNKPDTNAGPA
ncbi:hypothetical protein IFM89_017255 [Coptis chinensis]|uniref:RRM domain-containing protein n=1 Tax=Coptis chinensis TaxID=261450 RepID=A0A835LLY3_9MAGN|nr:hypothetical protein IFM89_017255 [Coptis chinensis]